MIKIRPEKISDYLEIYEVNRLAFGGQGEANLVDMLRQAEDFIPELSLVAEKDGRVVGHILFSKIVIRSREGDLPALALAPMAVLPEFQRQGIGSMLIKEGLEKCRNLGHGIIVVVGHPDYYPRFGFSPAREKGLETTFPVPDEAFMVLELLPGALDKAEGVVIYPTAFDDLE